MTSLTATTSRPTDSSADRLRRQVSRTAGRALLLTSVAGLISALTCLAIGVLLIMVADACFDLPMAARGSMLLCAVLAGLVVAWLGVIGPCRRGRNTRSAAAQIDHAAAASDQPVLRGLLLTAHDDDPFTAALRERALRRAADVVASTTPRSVFPISVLGRQGRWLWLACVGFVAFATLFPAQTPGLFARVLTPWTQTPPFSLTLLDPTWTPQPPCAGDNVAVTVSPQGVPTGAVDFIRLDSAGNEAERFAMTPDAQGGFCHTLYHVTGPITFVLETRDRATRQYTIDPIPREPDTTTRPLDTNDPDQPDGGATQGTPDPKPTINPTAQAAWSDLKTKVDGLLNELSAAEQRANATDPADPAALQALAEQLEELSARAAELADQLSTLQADLPADAAASLAMLNDALSGMQSARLPKPPTTDSTQPDNTDTPQDWLDRAEQAVNSDQRRIASGLGESDLDSGSATGSADPNAPTFIDPTTSGGYDEQGTIGDAGPLPPAVMRQVPPSYRGLVSAYFRRLAEQNPSPDDTP